MASNETQHPLTPSFRGEVLLDVLEFIHYQSERSSSLLSYVKDRRDTTTHDPRHINVRTRVLSHEQNSNSWTWQSLIRNHKLDHDDLPPGSDDERFWPLANCWTLDARSEGSRIRARKVLEGNVTKNMRRPIWWALSTSNCRERSVAVRRSVTPSRP